MHNCRFIEVAARCCQKTAYGRARIGLKEPQMKGSITAEPVPTAAQPQIKFA